MPKILDANLRYVFYDTWNFLDTTTICCILVAFIFRMAALEKEPLLFHAQFFYALSAPLLFSRLLVLSQIDATLGPMTQVSLSLNLEIAIKLAGVAVLGVDDPLAASSCFRDGKGRLNREFKLQVS